MRRATLIGSRRTATGTPSGYCRRGSRRKGSAECAHGSPGEAPPGAWVLAEIRNLRFRRPVLPGDQLVLKVELDKSLGAASRLSGKALVDDDVVAEGEFTLSRTEGGPSD